MPAIAALALGGLMVSATAANAAEAGLTVTAPGEGTTVASRTVTVTGSVFGGATVIVYAADGTTVLSRVNPGGTFGQPTPYSLTLPEYAEDASVAQTIVVGGIYGGSGIPQRTVNFSLPASYNFTVTSPTDGQTVDSRTVMFTGTGTDGSTVNVLTPAGDRVPGTTAAVVEDGKWMTTGTYADDAAISQTVNVNQVTGGAGRGEQSVTFSLPAVVPSNNFSVTSPTNGQTVDSRTVIFTGTGTDGSTVNVLTPAGDRVPGTTAAVVEDGKWMTTGTYADDAAISQTVNVNQVTGGAGRGEQSVTFNLPAVLLPAPVITSPADGSTVTGAAVTFKGTGTPGANVILAVVPTDLLNSASTKAAPVPADPEDPIVVDANGDWTVTLALDPNDYTAVAALAELNQDGTVADVTSEPSAPVEFTLVAAVTPVTPANPVVPAANASSTGSLAQTGAEPFGFLGLGAFLALAGTAVFVFRKKLHLS